MGSNQYRTQPKAVSFVPASPLLGQAAEPPSELVECGSVWGIKCGVRVGPPRWSHDDHPAFWMKAQAAERPGVPLHMLEMLARDTDSTMRARTAKNPTCPSSMLVRLARDSSVYVRWEAAKNPCCPPDILGRMGQGEPDDTIRQSVAANPGCPPATLERLLLDPVHAVAAAAADNPSQPRAVRAMWQLFDR